MVGADHVGLLVCNAFNVSIAREHIRPDLRFIETVRAHACLRLSWSLTLAAGVWRRRPGAPGVGDLPSARGPHRHRCALHRSQVRPRALGCPSAAHAPGGSIVESEDMLSLTGALMESHTGRRGALARHSLAPLSHSPRRLSVPFLQRLTTQAPETAEEERQRRKRERRAHRAAAEAAVTAGVAAAGDGGCGAAEGEEAVQPPPEGEQPKRRGGRAVRERGAETAAAAAAAKERQAAENDAPKHKKRRTEA